MLDCEDADCDAACTESSCSDDEDDDQDGAVDCLDEDCWGDGQCTVRLSATVDAGTVTAARTYGRSSSGADSVVAWHGADVAASLTGVVAMTDVATGRQRECAFEVDAAWLGSTACINDPACASPDSLWEAVGPTECGLNLLMPEPLIRRDLGLYGDAATTWLRGVQTASSYTGGGGNYQRTQRFALEPGSPLEVTATP